jgi:hypothetical protein
MEKPITKEEAESYLSEGTLLEQYKKILTKAVRVESQYPYCAPYIVLDLMVMLNESLQVMEKVLKDSFEKNRVKTIINGENND